jgi:hypothetical protein
MMRRTAVLRVGVLVAAMMLSSPSARAQVQNRRATLQFAGFDSMVVANVRQLGQLPTRAELWLHHDSVGRGFWRNNDAHRAARAVVPTLMRLLRALRATPALQNGRAVADSSLVKLEYDAHDGEHNDLVEPVVTAIESLPNNRYRVRVRRIALDTVGELITGGEALAVVQRVLDAHLPTLAQQDTARQPRFVCLSYGQSLSVSPPAFGLLASLARRGLIAIDAQRCPESHVSMVSIIPSQPEIPDTPARGDEAIRIQVQRVVRRTDGVAFVYLHTTEGTSSASTFCEVSASVSVLAKCTRPEWRIN